MQDRQILSHIQTLVAEEHELEQHGRRLGPEQLRRLHQIEAELDQSWDLLRQRRARRRAGLDPDIATERPREMVGYYQQ